MVDELSLSLGIIFGILGAIIITGCVKNCKDIIKAEKEMKEKVKSPVLPLTEIVIYNSEDPI